MLVVLCVGRLIALLLVLRRFDVLVAPTELESEDRQTAWKMKAHLVSGVIVR